MDANLCEKDETQVQAEIVISQDALCDKNQKTQLSNCRCIVNDELTCTQTTGKVSVVLL